MLALLALCVLLLFVGGPDAQSTRSLRQGWQFGHVLLFFVAARLALPFFRRRFGAGASVALVLLAAALLGALVEWLQGFVGREVSWADVRLDVIGAALGSTAVGAGRARWILPAFALVLLTWLDALPLGRALLDEYRARRDFPVLASWASDLELGRMQPAAGMRREHAPERPGERALRVLLQPVPYARPGVAENNPLDSETEIVRVGIYVDNNYHVDLSGPTYSSNGFYWLRWSPRLQQRLTALNMSANSMIEFANQVDNWDSTIRPLSDEPQRFSNGDYYQIYEYSGLFFIGDVNLRKYPFYTLKLPITLEANDQTNAFTFPFLRLVPDATSSGIG
ncbi:MAG: VanZ family protein, partial [Gammaproteobacteria bacterium]